MHAGTSKQARCRCYLLHPGDPDTTQQSEERKDLRVSMGEGAGTWKRHVGVLGEGLKASSNKAFIQSPFSLNNALELCLMCALACKLFTCTLNVQMAGSFVSNITEKYAPYLQVMQH